MIQTVVYIRNLCQLLTSTVLGPHYLLYILMAIINLAKSKIKDNKEDFEKTQLSLSNP